MKKVILTESNTERLKILSFLFRVSGWANQVVEDLSLATDYYHKLNQKEPLSTVLVIVDYDRLGADREERIEKLEGLTRAVPADEAVIVAAYDWPEPERTDLLERVSHRSSVLTCQSHQIIDSVHRYRMTRQHCTILARHARN